MTSSRPDILLRVLGPAASVVDDQLQSNGRLVPLLNRVYRFRTDDGYNRSFALQWKKFQLEQYDRMNQTDLYFKRFNEKTGWPVKGLEGETILEAGCGAGAFTSHLVRTGADIVSFDYSSAVEVSALHNSANNVVFAQADIMDMPFQPGAFDRVFCFGVLQHTPDPEKAFRKLESLVVPGGHIAVDIYQKDRKIRTWKAKYLWRPLTRRMDPDRLMSFLEFFIPKWLPFDTLIKRIPLFGRYIGSVIPCMNYMWLDIAPSERIRWSIMNTFDALAPAYDSPMRAVDVRRWFEDCGYVDFEIEAWDGIVVARGTKPR